MRVSQFSACRRSALALLAWLPLAACAGARPAGGEGAEPFKALTVDEVDAMMTEAKAGKRALFVFDNNSKEHFAEDGHLPGAKWVVQFVKAEDLPADKEATLVFYCMDDL